MEHCIRDGKCLYCGQTHGTIATTGVPCIPPPGTLLGIDPDTGALVPYRSGMDAAGVIDDNGSLVVTYNGINVPEFFKP